jgi:hypothetical protein
VPGPIAESARGAGPGEASQPDGSSKAQLPLAPAPSAPVPESIPEIEMTGELSREEERVLVFDNWGVVDGLA